MPVSREITVQTLRDPEQAQDCEYEGTVVDETAGALVLEDGEEGPGDSDRTREVALGRRKSVGSGGRLKEEESEEDEDFRPDARTCGNCVDAECLEGGEENEHGRPAVVEGEGEMYPELVVQ